MNASSKVPLTAAGAVLAILTAALLTRVLVATDPPEHEPGAQAATTTSTADDRARATPREETTTSALPPAVADPWADSDEIHRVLTETFHEDFAPLIDQAEAHCLAQAVVDTLGADRLTQIGEALGSAEGPPADPGGLGPLTPEENQELDERMRLCVPEETAARLNL